MSVESELSMTVAGEHHPLPHLLLLLPVREVHHSQGHEGKEAYLSQDYRYILYNIPRWAKWIVFVIKLNLLLPCFGLLALS